MSISVFRKAHKLNSELVDFLVNREELFDLLEFTPTLIEHHIASRSTITLLLTYYMYKRGLSKVFYSSRNLQYISHFLLSYLQVNLNEEFTEADLEDTNEDDIVNALESIVDNHAHYLPSNLTSIERYIVLTLAKNKTPNDVDTNEVWYALAKVGLYRQTTIGNKKVVDGKSIGADSIMLDGLLSTWNSLYQPGKIEDPTNFDLAGIMKIINHNILYEEPDFDEIVNEEQTFLKEYKDSLNSNEFI